MTQVSAGRRSIFRRLARKGAFGLIIALFLVIVLWKHMVVTVPAGNVGVIWWRFFGGTSLTAPAVGSGTHFIFPWDKLYIYDARMQEHTRLYDAITKEGLSIRITVSFRWKVIPSTLGALNETIGPDYREKLLIPEIGSYLRREVSQFTAEELFTTRRAQVQDEIYTTLVDRSVNNGIGDRDDIHEPGDLLMLTDVLLKGIELPERLRVAIEKKLEQAQVVEEYGFRVEREKLESERKAIEADGIRRFQNIVTPTISDSYLRWRGVEATLKLAESENAKIVIVGNGPGSLPVILNGLESQPTAAPAAGTEKADH